MHSEASLLAAWSSPRGIRRGRPNATALQRNRAGVRPAVGLHKALDREGAGSFRRHQSAPRGRYLPAKGAPTRASSTRLSADRESAACFKTPRAAAAWPDKAKGAKIPMQTPSPVQPFWGNGNSHCSPGGSHGNDGVIRRKRELDCQRGQKPWWKARGDG
jgi:hypothetical protein